MSTKRYCDGCDTEMASADGKVVQVAELLGQGDTMGSYFPPDGLKNRKWIDLCGSCHGRFMDSLPAQWPRAKST